MLPVAGRNISALLNPRPLALIGASFENEIDFATIAWTMPLSHDPAMVAFALRASSRTFQLAQRSGWFSLCIPGAAMTDLVSYCGNHTGNNEDKAEVIPYTFLSDTGWGNEPAAHDSTTERVGVPPSKPQASTPAIAILSEMSAITEMPTIPVIPDALSVLICEVESSRQAGDHSLTCAFVREAYTRCPTDAQGRVLSMDALLCVQHDVFTHAEPS